MLVRPHTLSIITTHQCTAACDHCCFHCTPKVAKAIPFERMERLIDEAREVPSIRAVVFTGGECYLLGPKLDALVARATSYGFRTRTVTNGYWATSRKAASQRIGGLVKAGLKEVNLSTGTFHSRYVPVEHIIHAAYCSVQAGLVTVINAEIFANSDFDFDAISKHPDLVSMIEDGRLMVQRNVWMENGGETKLDHNPEHTRFHPDVPRVGCTTIMNVITVTPDQDLVACCGLTQETIPELHLGNLESQSIRRVLDETQDDFLKIWIHVDGPERILEFVKSHDPEYELPIESVHPCQTCLFVHQDERARRVIREHYREVEDRVIEMYLTMISSTFLVEEQQSMSEHSGRR